MTQAYTENKKVLDFVNASAELAQPDNIVWIDGSDAQIDALREEACSTGEMICLNQEKLPGCYYHRTAENDVARVEARTFICCRDEKDAGPTNYWMDPKEAYPMLREIARGKMKAPIRWASSAPPSPASASRSPTPSTSSSICAS